MNKAVLIGRLTKDPEVRYTQNGKAVASFTLAVNRQGKDAGADFIPVVAWEKLAEVIGNNLAKGRQCAIEGRIQIRTYEKDGTKRYVTEVVASNMYFCDSKNSENQEPSPTESMGSEVFPEEEIPF